MSAWEQLKHLVLSGSCSTYVYSLKSSACYLHNRDWTSAIHKGDDHHKHQAISYILSMVFSQDTFCFSHSPEKNFSKLTIFNEIEFPFSVQIW